MTTRYKWQSMPIVPTPDRTVIIAESSDGHIRYAAVHHSKSFDGIDPDEVADSLGRVPQCEWLSVTIRWMTIVAGSTEIECLVDDEGVIVSAMTSHATEGPWGLVGQWADAWEAGRLEELSLAD